jgi:aldose sugar dehydrogenase
VIRRSPHPPTPEPSAPRTLPNGMLHARSLLLLLVPLAASCGIIERNLLRPGDPPEEVAGATLESVPPGTLRVVAEEIAVPWAIAFLPDGSLLVTERPGRLLRLPAPAPSGPPLRPRDGQAWEIPGVSAGGEGGLMGLALHPRFAETGWLYLMFTAEGTAGTENRVERYRLTDDGPADRTVIVEGIRGGRNHNGGAIAFGPDGNLYIGTGDAGRPVQAQDSTTLAGSILRVTESGAVPEGNPLGSTVWSWGHRNVQGITWDRDGNLWATEHGRSGFRSGMDELNRIEAGRNYGWPQIEGDLTAPGMEPPVAHSGPDYTWAPAGAAWLDGRVFFGGLRGESLYEARVGANEGGVGLHAHFFGELGRIRAVAAGSDGGLYFGTSNQDGRGRVRTGDDRILRIDPAALRSVREAGSGAPEWAPAPAG